MTKEIGVLADMKQVRDILDRLLRKYGENLGGFRNALVAGRADENSLRMDFHNVLYALESVK